MSGLLRRLTRRRPATADETGLHTPESSEPAGASADTPAEPGGGRPVPDEQPTQVLPGTAVQPAAAEPPPAEPAPRRDLPAGIDPHELALAPAASAGRGKLRRRLRYLRAVRELLLRDLGGFVFETQRTGGGTGQEAHRRLVESKASRIATLDAEVRGLEQRLGEPHGTAVLHEPGIGGLCPECGELHASEAHYCSRCGAPLDAKARARRDAAMAAAAQPTTGSHTVAEPAPASVLWAAGPQPRVRAEPAREEEAEPSAVTSQWLALPGTGEHEPAAPPAQDDPRAPAADPEPQDEPAAASDEPATEVVEPEAEAAEEKPEPRSGADKPETFDPAPNGHGDGPVADPLASRPEQGS